MWSAECEASFQTLKEKLTTAPVLVLPDIHKALTSIAMHLVKDSAAFLCRKAELWPMHLVS